MGLTRRIFSESGKKVNMHYPNSKLFLAVVDETNCVKYLTLKQWLESPLPMEVAESVQSKFIGALMRDLSIKELVELRMELINIEDFDTKLRILREKAGVNVTKRGLRIN